MIGYNNGKQAVVSVTLGTTLTAYFSATYAGAELDLLLVKNGRRLGVEYKRTDAPRLTASMQIALADLALHHLTVIYPGDRGYLLADRVTVVPLTAIATAGAQAIDPFASAGFAP